MKQLSCTGSKPLKHCKDLYTYNRAYKVDQGKVDQSSITTSLARLAVWFGVKPIGDVGLRTVLFHRHIYGLIFLKLR